MQEDGVRDAFLWKAERVRSGEERRTERESRSFAHFVLPIAQTVSKIERRTARRHRMKKRLVLLSLFCAALAFFSACTEPGSSAGKQKFTLYVQGKVWKEISFEPGASVELPTPSPAGYTFFGWYEDPAFQVPFLERLTYEEGGALYAKLVEDPAIGGLQGAESNMRQVCRSVRRRQ